MLRLGLREILAFGLEFFADPASASYGRSWGCGRAALRWVSAWREVVSVAASFLLKEQLTKNWNGQRDLVTDSEQVP